MSMNPAISSKKLQDRRQSSTCTIPGVPKVRTRKTVLGKDHILIVEKLVEKLGCCHSNVYVYICVIVKAK